jgi:phosphatidylglycerol lysyltransferase
MFPIVFPEQQLAADLVHRYGTSSNDYFKLWPDKEYLFSKSGDGVVAFGVSHHLGFAYGDPTAPPNEIGRTIDEFVAHCHQHNWTPIFYQVTPQYLDIYRQKGFRVFKASEDAIVDLQAFTLTGKDAKHHRSVLNRFERDGITAQLFTPPVPQEIIAQAQIVSDLWLASGRRERKFVLGRFSETYVRNTPMLAAIDATGLMLGFVNMIPSYADSTATIDMMRHREDGPNGTMDFLFLKLFEYNKAQGFRYFSLGPAPIVETEPNADASVEEKLYYKAAQHLDFYFSMTGLRQYKAKFATIWEPHYLIYPHTLDLVRIFQALSALSELPENKVPILSQQRRQQVKAVTQEIIHDISAARAARRHAQTNPPSVP